MSLKWGQWKAFRLPFVTVVFHLAQVGNINVWFCILSIHTQFQSYLYLICLVTLSVLFSYFLSVGQDANENQNKLIIFCLVFSCLVFGFFGWIFRSKCELKLKALTAAALEKALYIFQKIWLYLPMNCLLFTHFSFLLFWEWLLLSIGVFREYHLDDIALHWLICCVLFISVPLWKYFFKHFGWIKNAWK